MNYIIKLLVAAMLPASISSAAILQNFNSTVGPDTYFYGSWEANGLAGTNSPNAAFIQGSGIYTITGTGVNDSNTSFVEFYFPQNADIGSDGFLSVTAQTLVGNTASSFQVTLYDTSARTAIATFLTSAFTGGNTVVASLTFQSSFNSSEIEFFRVSGAQLGGTADFKVAFDNIATSLAAIPEPSSFALFIGIAGLSVSVIRRRKLFA